MEKLKTIKKYKVVIYLSMLLVSLSIFGCSKKVEELPIAKIDIEGFGIIKAELYPSDAPNTVNNFIYLANSGFYDNLNFHRITNYFIQGGRSSKGPDYTIKGEFKENSFNNKIKHEKGTLSMVRTSDNMDSASSQFFILRKDAPNMDGTHAGFGKVIEGMDILDNIGKIKTEKRTNKPKKEVVIKSIRVVDAEGKEYEKPKILEKQNREK